MVVASALVAQRDAVAPTEFSTPDACVTSAMHILRMPRIKSTDAARAARLVEESMRSDNPVAYRLAGACCRRGIALPHGYADDTPAMYYRMAADRGDEPAARVLAMLDTIERRGAQMTPVLELVLLTVETDSPTALQQLANCFRFGVGVVQDTEIAQSLDAQADARRPTKISRSTLRRQRHRLRSSVAVQEDVHIVPKAPSGGAEWYPPPQFVGKEYERTRAFPTPPPRAAPSCIQPIPYARPPCSRWTSPSV